jgi:late competence protein required for DNA uptake (superfamily II DNA/RNA helicase)
MFVCGHPQNYAKPIPMTEEAIQNCKFWKQGDSIRVLIEEGKGICYRCGANVFFKDLKWVAKGTYSCKNCLK